MKHHHWYGLVAAIIALIFVLLVVNRLAHPVTGLSPLPPITLGLLAALMAGIAIRERRSSKKR